MDLKKGISYQLLSFCAVAIALCIGHFKLSEAADNDKNWVPVASTILSLPLLIAFPIGTYLGVKLLVNALRLKPAEQ